MLGDHAIPPFRYMDWAKRHTPGPRYNLAKSGAPSLSWEELAIDPAAMFTKIRGAYGDDELKARIAARYGVPVEEVVLTVGSSLAYPLVEMALLRRDDVVLVETPCYEVLSTLPELLGAEVRAMNRGEKGTPPWRGHPARGFHLPVERIVDALGEGARLVIASDLHNPTGRGIGEAEILAVAEACEANDAWFLVSEVYRDFKPGPVGTARALHPRIVTVSSATKVYGLGGLRVGWIFAPVELADRLRRLTDYFHVENPGPSHAILLQLWHRLDEIRERHRALGARGWEITRAWIESRDDVDVVAPDGGMICFPRIKSRGSARDLVAKLEAEHETIVVPGMELGLPKHVRIGFGLDEETLREGLARLGTVLDQMG